ncbi:hypothetical protein HOLleu_09162 [Holothuria leucospilota]|uniref:Uncharacterized protein n=1 Tax=Holothuria leucospilota TaxID=206669 RepID=A0A9Q1CJR2_HOLLE|nr:hypothetical protein HOLleu_09162 [Holothuria leucospilota]
MNGTQDFCPTSSLQNVDLPTNDATPPDAHVIEGDLTEEGNSNRSDLMSVEALINKYASHSRETIPSESCELDEHSVVNFKDEDFTNEVGFHENRPTENGKDEYLLPSIPAKRVPSASDGKDTCVSSSNDTPEDAGEETFKEGNDHHEKLENNTFENRQEQDVSTNHGPNPVKPLMPQIRDLAFQLTDQIHRQTVEETENSTDVGNEETKKKKVSWQVGGTKPKKTTKKAAASVFRGSMASTVTTIAGLKKWKLKARQDTQSDFEKYPGHLRVVQEHLRQEKTETPLTIRQDVKKEVLPILANIVRAYKKELVGEHRLLREATLKYEKLKSELQDAFL